jgi:hypothetical protein
MLATNAPLTGIEEIILIPIIQMFSAIFGKTVKHRLKNLADYSSLFVLRVPPGSLTPTASRPVPW